MPYPEIMIYGMRQELAQLGIEETKTTEEVNEAVKNTDGTLMVVVNSVCGCAAGGVRPGIAMALQNSRQKPDRRSRFLLVPTSMRRKRRGNILRAICLRRPAIGFLKNGELVQMFERRDLEGRPPAVIAQALIDAFQHPLYQDRSSEQLTSQKHCNKAALTGRLFCVCSDKLCYCEVECITD